MYPQDLALEALAYILVSGTSSNATLLAASNPQKRRIAHDISAAMAEIYDLSPYFFRRNLTASLAAPQSTTVTVTNGSRTITTAGTFVEGGTMAIEGSFYQASSNAGNVELNGPWAGTSGVKAATIYSDVIALEESHSKVIDSVMIPGVGKLSLRNNKTQLLGGAVDFPDYGRRLRTLGGNPIIGTPNSYLTETQVAPNSGVPTVTRWIRVHPMPNVLTRIDYEVILNPEVYTVASLGVDDAPGTDAIACPDRGEEIVRAFFLNKWQASPWFKDKDARREIKEDYQVQKARLTEKHNSLKRPIVLTPSI